MHYISAFLVNSLTLCPCKKSQEVKNDSVRHGGVLCALVRNLFMGDGLKQLAIGLLKQMA